MLINHQSSGPARGLLFRLEFMCFEATDNFVDGRVEQLKSNRSQVVAFSFAPTPRSCGFASRPLVGALNERTMPRYGRMLNADPGKVSSRAKKPGARVCPGARFTAGARKLEFTPWCLSKGVNLCGRALFSGTHGNPPEWVPIFLFHFQTPKGSIQRVDL